MKPRSTAFLLAIFFVVLAHSQNYVDFSYSEFDQNQGKPPRPV